MAFEPAVIEQWIYDTLSGDATLQGLLAVNNLPNNYQQGIYAYVAPQVDPISRKQPKTPYVVFDRAGSGGNDEDTLCGSRVFTYPTYRITVWDTSSGALSMGVISSIMDRVDALLDNQHVSSTTPRFYCRRESTAQTFAMENGGRMDYGVTAVYRFVTQQ